MTYKHLTRPVLEYACPAWAPIASDTNIRKLQTVQNAALRCATGHTRDTNQTHYHNETQALPRATHMRLITSQYREGARDPDHPPRREATVPDPVRRMKSTAFHTSQVTVVHGCAPLGEEKKEVVRNKRRLHTVIVQDHINLRPQHPLINAQPPVMHKSELTLPRKKEDVLRNSGHRNVHSCRSTCTPSAQRSTQTAPCATKAVTTPPTCFSAQRSHRKSLHSANS